jgi:hypothetical protein
MTATDIETGAAVLTVVSPKHGTFRALVDQEDYERVSQHTWGVLKNKKGHVYFQTMIRKPDGKQTTILLHRFLMNVTDPKVIVDHKNHDYLDCRKGELRVCTKAENTQNQRKHRNNTSGFKGVSWHKNAGKYQVQIRVNGKVKHLGLRDCPIQAAKLYDAAAIGLHGEFAHLNFPREAAAA